MGQWTYLVILALTFAAAAWLEAWPGVRVLRAPRRLALAMLPGLCIFATSICFNMASDGLRTAMDVRS